MILRKDVNVYLKDPSSKFFHVVVELKNVPGALHGVLGALSEMNMNILGSFSSADSTAETGVWSGFVKDSNHKASDLKKKMASSEYVLDSIVVESKKGFLVDGIHFPLALNTGDRAVMMRAKYLVRMFDRIREEFGTGGESIVFEEGLAYGMETWINFGARIGLGFVRKNLHDVLKVYQALGWFKLEATTQRDRGKTTTIRTSENFECHDRVSHGPYSQFIRGHLCGALTVITGKDIDCEETSCEAVRGPVCEFVLRRRRPSTRTRSP